MTLQFRATLSSQTLRKVLHTMDDTLGIGEGGLLADCHGITFSCMDTSHVGLFQTTLNVHSQQLTSYEFQHGREDTSMPMDLARLHKILPKGTYPLVLEKFSGQEFYTLRESEGHWSLVLPVSQDQSGVILIPQDLDNALTCRVTMPHKAFAAVVREATSQLADAPILHIAVDGNGTVALSERETKRDLGFLHRGSDRVSVEDAGESFAISISAAFLENALRMSGADSHDAVMRAGREHPLLLNLRNKLFAYTIAIAPRVD